MRRRESLAAKSINLLIKRYIVDKEVKHVRFGESCSNVRALKDATFVVLSMNLLKHWKFSDEYVTAFCKENLSFSGDHLRVWIRLHDFLDASQGQLMNLVIVILRLDLAV